MKLTLRTDGNFILEQEGGDGIPITVERGSTYRYDGGNHYVNGKVATEEKPDAPAPIPPKPPEPTPSPDVPDGDVPPAPDDGGDVPVSDNPIPSVDVDEDGNVVIPDPFAPSDDYTGNRENGEVSANGGKNMVFNNKGFNADSVHDFSITHPYSYNIINAEHLKHTANNLIFDLNGVNSIKHFEGKTYAGFIKDGTLMGRIV